MDAQTFIKSLEGETLCHEAVVHPFLVRFSSDKLTTAQIQIFGLQHYQLVKVFVNYMTNLLSKIPDKDAYDLFRTVFEDELGQYTIFRSHPALYRNFLRAVDAKDEDWGKVPLLPETSAFIEEHLEFTRGSDFLFSLGAVGPGHEFSIPTMFGYLVKGIRNNTTLTEEQYEYFTCHMEQDVEHAKIFNQLIARYTETEDGQKHLRAGTMRSLALRKYFWDGLNRAVFQEK
ncbi:MAG: iron-containing redox enzyme family protein [Nitrospirota bacterium]